MAFSPANYSSIFDNINNMTKKKDIVRALRISTGKKKKYIEELYEMAKILEGKPIWIITELEQFFDRKLNVMPFLRPEFFIGGYDYNGIGTGEKRIRFERENKHHYEDETIIYVTACGLKKMLLILSLGERIED